jgi:Tfp pilus assembly protein PilF
MRLAIAVLLSCMVSACAIAPFTPPPGLFADGAFVAPSEPISAAEIFKLSPEMKTFVSSRIGPQVKTSGPRLALLEALYADGQLKLEYDADMTRNAAQAFAARSGNCLSLVIMTAAFAKELDLSIRYQNVLVEDTWSRDGTLYVSIGHVNITLTSRSAGRHDGESTIDFLPPRDLRNQRSRPISERTVVAMYMNNRAVEALARGRLDDAYWWAREAIEQDPVFLISYNTLGAVYERRGMPGNAERVFAHVLEREPSNTHVIANLVAALNEQGRTAEASAWSRIANERDPDPPFSFFNRGLEAMKARDYTTARDLFAREVKRAEHYHEFHYWLAAAYVGLGDYSQARKHLKVAMENSTTRRDHDLYAAKFAWITSHAN